MQLDLEQLIKHPQTMDKETLYDLRSLIALYPYFQTARLLMLQNLYILHDPSFDEELRKAAIYITDRKMIFRLIEAAHYKIKSATTERSQLLAFCRFITKNPQMHAALQAKKWATFARLYNGSEYAKNQYDTKLLNAYKAYAAK